jgi:hypothetical protein
MGVSFTTAAGPRHRNHFQVRVPHGSWPYYTVSDSRLPQPGRLGPRLYIPQEQGGPVIPPDTGFPFRRLLWLAGLRWMYWTPPSYNSSVRTPRKIRVTCYQECLFTGSLSSNGWPSIVEGQRVAMVIYVTIYKVYTVYELTLIARYCSYTLPDIYLHGDR